MAKIQLYFYVFLVISCECSAENEMQCPKSCQCETSIETGLKVKCENVKEIKDIIFGNYSSEVVHL